MNHEEILNLIQEDFREFKGPREAVDAAGRTSGLDQKYLRLLMEETHKLADLKNKLDKIEEILYRSYRSTKTQAMKVYPDDLIGIENVDFGFDPVEGPDKVPATEEAKTIMARGNRAYRECLKEYTIQAKMVEILADIYKYKTKHRIDCARIIIDDMKAKS